MKKVKLLERMRSEWNRRAKKDAHFYVAFGRQKQSEEEFRASAAETMPIFEQEFPRLPPGLASQRRALEIGCGPGRLLLPMTRHFGEVHGVDVSDEMAALARKRFRDVPNVHVHVNSGVDLGMFTGEYFDFVYSYIVFQHIPSHDIVLGYLREAQRVLRPGGVLCCQVRGTKPLESELRRESETWTGCWFTAHDLAKFAREQRFPLVAISGVDTQYMWVTFRKPIAGVSPYVLERVVVKAVTATSGPEARVPARGREAAISLWIDGMPESASLADCEVSFGDRQQLGCYLSPVTESGGCQLDARLPAGLAAGEYPVGLRIEGQPLTTVHPVVVLPPPPYAPKVLSITDGINLTSKYRVETGGVKVIIEDLQDPTAVSFSVAGKPAEFMQYECKDPITATYEFAFHLARRTPRGRQPLIVRINGRELPPLNVEVAR